MLIQPNSGCADVSTNRNHHDQFPWGTFLIGKIWQEHILRSTARAILSFSRTRPGPKQISPSKKRSGRCHHEAHHRYPSDHSSDRQGQVQELSNTRGANRRDAHGNRSRISPLELAIRSSLRLLPRRNPCHPCTSTPRSRRSALLLIYQSTGQRRYQGQADLALQGLFRRRGP